VVAVSQAEDRAAANKRDVTRAKPAQAVARPTRAREELKDLEGLATKRAVFSPVSGIITTPHLKERRGQYLHEGDLICVVEEPADVMVAPPPSPR